MPLLGVYYISFGPLQDSHINTHFGRGAKLQPKYLAINKYKSVQIGCKIDIFNEMIPPSTGGGISFAQECIAGKYAFLHTKGRCRSPIRACGDFLPD